MPRSARTPSRTFADRREAGRELGRRLTDVLQLDEPLVLGLPRGGVPVAYEVAEALGAPLDVFVVRKLGVPGHEELAMGAIATGGVRVLNERVVRVAEIGADVLQAVARRELTELQRREGAYREGRPPMRVTGRNVVLVDDGLATGASMHAAVTAVRRLDAGTTTVAVPVASQDTCSRFEPLVDAVVCLETPMEFAAVGQWYTDFSPTEDEEVRALLRDAARRRLD